MDWVGYAWDLCVGLLYEHRFAMLIIVINSNNNKTIPDGGVAPHHFLRLDCITRKDLKEV